MERQHSGWIINIASAGGKLGFPFTGVFSLFAFCLVYHRDTIGINDGLYMD
jgi:hypothetical protein